MRRVIDSHSHLHGGYTGLNQFLEESAALYEEARVVQAVAAGAPQWSPEYVNQNPLLMLFKLKNPKKIYAYAGLDYYTPEGIGPRDFLEQVKRYMAMGYDGIKLLEMKPMILRNLGQAWLSKPCYEEMFAYLEEKQIPEQWHDFFVKYQNRIILGTDNGGLSADGMTPMSEKMAYARNNVANICRFLETSDEFEGYGFKIKGIGLPNQVVDKICYGNFEAMVGFMPRMADVPQVLDYTKELLDLYKDGYHMEKYNLSYPLLEQIYAELKKFL